MGKTLVPAPKWVEVKVNGAQMKISPSGIPFEQRTVHRGIPNMSNSYCIGDAMLVWPEGNRGPAFLLRKDEQKTPPPAQQ
ncbi:MAG: hypothetical protein K9M10_03705 [Candidatus Pacebacteria bacterium]|nr:hypothetical protein [Candidatus Paceibacterota bacterium]MCF7857557.1 hypothetical protein [Candidatus Paceibacterota bacterium]